MTWVKREWVDAKAFAGWLDDRDVAATEIDPDGTLISKWRNGHYRFLSIWRADKILSNLGYHLSELPEEFIVKRPRDMLSRKGRVSFYPEHVKREALAARERGDSLAKISREYGPAADTILDWQRHERTKVS
jgi:hypothetical protein